MYTLIPVSYTHLLDRGFRSSCVIHKNQYSFISDTCHWAFKFINRYKWVALIIVELVIVKRLHAAIVSAH